MFSPSPASSRSWKQLLCLMFCIVCACSWRMFCLLCHCLFECLSRHSVLIHNLCKKRCRKAVMFCKGILPQLNSASFPPPPPLLLCSSLSCVPHYSPISLLSAPLINCACFSRPKTACCSPLHPLFVSCDLRGALFLNILTLSPSLLVLCALSPPSPPFLSL